MNFFWPFNKLKTQDLEIPEPKRDISSLKTDASMTFDLFPCASVAVSLLPLRGKQSLSATRGNAPSLSLSYAARPVGKIILGNLA